MECEILASVMNQKDKDETIKRLSISNNDKCVIINQVTRNIDCIKNDCSKKSRFFSFKEKGLSRSRNRAIGKSIGDICILSDDDMEFVLDYQEIVKKAYEKHPDADIICFDFVRADKTRKTMREGKVGFLRSMKISSAQITFKKASILKSGVRFDENFGAGSAKCDWGEENIFLFDCLRAGLKIYYAPKVVRISEYNPNTTWDRSNTPEHFERQGWFYYRMSSMWWRVLALQFALRKRKIYREDMSGWEVYRSMVRGAKNYRKEIGNG